MRIRWAILFLFLHLLLPAIVHAQDLTGTWTGSATIATYVELVIVRSGNQYVGFSYDEGMGHCKANFAGTFDTVAQKLKGKGMGFIEKTFGHGQGSYNLRYSHKNGVDFLEGSVSPKSAGGKILSFGIPTHLVLRRTRNSVDTTDFMKQSLAVGNNPIKTNNTDSLPIAVDENEVIITMKESRQTDTLQTILTSERKIIIKLFDNGIEDNDSVSILHNGRIVVRQQLISAKPFTFEIELDSTDVEHDITLVAHNLGSIPPNTAMVIIEAGSNRYSLSATSSLSRNAMIRVRYEANKKR